MIRGFLSLIFLQALFVHKNCLASSYREVTFLNSDCNESTNCYGAPSRITIKKILNNIEENPSSSPPNHFVEIINGIPMDDEKLMVPSQSFYIQPNLRFLEGDGAIETNLRSLTRYAVNYLGVGFGASTSSLLVLGGWMALRQLVKFNAMRALSLRFEGESATKIKVAVYDQVDRFDRAIKPLGTASVLSAGVLGGYAVYHVSSEYFGAYESGIGLVASALRNLNGSGEPRILMAVKQKTMERIVQLLNSMSVQGR